MNDTADHSEPQARWEFLLAEAVALKNGGAALPPVGADLVRGHAAGARRDEGGLSIATIARNHRGWRVGACHGRAKLTDEEVRKMRRMYRPGLVGYEALAETFGCGPSTARDICLYRTRASA